MNVFIQTFGCSLNYSDGELMAGLLQEAGHEIVQDLKDTDILIINSCTVKNEAEAKLWRWIKNNPDKKIVAAGCVAQAQPSLLKDRLKNISVIGTNNINDIIEAVQATSEGKLFQSIKTKKYPRLNLPHIRKNPIVEIIPINKGCLDSCTYCLTKRARGHLQSYPVKDIKKQCETAISEGCKEIWLTSQDTGCYGLDINSNIIELLKELLGLRGFFRIRLGMMNPNYALQFLEELKEIFKHPKIFKFLHIPVQSGSNKVLRDMKRRYKVEAYKRVVEEIRQAIPNITISTDIIVAYPTETKEEFKETYNLIKETKPEVLNLSRFWARPSTPAAKLKQITGTESKVRSKKINDLFRKIQLESQQKWIGWEGEVLIDEVGTKNSMIGRNDYYKQVVFRNSKLKIGERRKVKILYAKQYDLRPSNLNNHA